MAVALGITWHADALMIELDLKYDTNGFFNANPAAQTALEAAATIYENLIVDRLDEIRPASDRSWVPTFTHPGTGARFPDPLPTQENPNVPERNRFVPANTLVVFAGGRNLDGSALGVAGPGGAIVGLGDNDWAVTVNTRGESNTFGANATDFGPWGGAVSFDTHVDAGSTTARNWHFDPSTLPGPGDNDFFSVALHEFGHILGIGTSAAWHALVTTDENGQNFFNGPSAVETFGGPIPLQDGSFPSHFAASGIFPEPLLDPNLTTGTRKLLTELDVAALRDIGWQIVPEPTTLTVIVTTVLLLFGRRTSPYR